MGSQAFGYESPSKIMDEIARVTPAYTGLSHQRLEEGPGLQWPVPASNHPGTAALPFAREVSLTAVAPGVLSRPRSNHAVVYNYLLREIDGIRTLQGKAVAELSTQDARSQGIVEGEQIEVSTPFGSVTAVAKLSASVPSGCIYVAHPWGSTLDHLLHQVAPPASIRLSHIKVCFATVRALASKPV
jgi:predicted molibdopterin-dependent oxidoreductase YjgC